MSEVYHQVVAGARLHFGMFSFGEPGVRQFGGVGCMLEGPTITVRILAAERWELVGDFSARAERLMRRLIDQGTLASPPRCRIEIDSATREHVGLGVGTQFELALADGLASFLDRPREAWLSAVGRGERSHVGSYGYRHGGLIVEAGRHNSEDAAPLVSRVELPTAWRFVLVVPKAERGLHGPTERSAFSQLPPVSREVTAELCRETLLELVPAAQAKDFARFSASLYRFGLTAGKCFAAVQGGPFASPRVANLVARLRDWQIEGVGQSSWGPLVFALLPSAAAAEQLVARSRSESLVSEAELFIAAPRNLPTIVETIAVS